MTELSHLWKLYLPLIAWISCGWWLGRTLPASIPTQLGKFLFWIGVPLSILAFLRQADLSAAVWMAPVAAWIAIGLGMSLAWLWLKLQQTWPHLPIASGFSKLGWLFQSSAPLTPQTQGSFLLAAMVGNTGYLGYPIALAIVGPQYFGWAVFYDTLGSTLGAYGLGVILAAKFGNQATQPIQLLLALLRNPALWSFWIGLGMRNLQLPLMLEQGFSAIAWTVVALSLLLLGMRLGQLHGRQQLHQATISLIIKMMIVPLLLGLSLPYLGIISFPQLAIVLQAGMPPAFATLVIAEAYDLDRNLTVTTLALGSLLLLFALPIWLLLFMPQ